MANHQNITKAKNTPTNPILPYTNTNAACLDPAVQSNSLANNTALHPNLNFMNSQPHRPTNSQNAIGCLNDKQGAMQTIQPPFNKNLSFTNFSHALNMSNPATRRASVACSTFAKSANIAKQKAETQVQHYQYWATSYLKAFPKYQFYFNNVDETKKQELKGLISYLGGTTSQDFRTNITHVINEDLESEFVNCKRLKPIHPHVGINGLFLPKINENVNKNNQKIKDDELTRLAHSCNMKVWSVDKLENKILRNLVNYKNKQLQINSHLSVTPCNYSEKSVPAMNNTKNTPVELPSIFNKNTTQLNPACISNPTINNRTFSFSNSAQISSTASNQMLRSQFDIHYLKYVYLLVEDTTSKHKPVIVVEYPFNSSRIDSQWPRFYRNPTTKCPFIKYHGKPTGSNNEYSNMFAELRFSQFSDHEEDNVTIPQRTAAQNLNTHLSKPQISRNNIMYLIDHNEDAFSPAANNGASFATISTTAGYQSNMSFTTSKPNDRNESPELERLKERVCLLPRYNNQKPYIPPKSKKYRNSSAANIQKAQPPQKKSGYCENCRVKFSDIEEHVESQMHRIFAMNCMNFRSLDGLISKLGRPIRTPNLTSTYTHNTSSSPGLNSKFLYDCLYTKENTNQNSSNISHLFQK